MACRSCKRQLLTLARQANTPVAAELSGSVLGQQFHRVATKPITHQQQRRGFRSTPTRSGILGSIRSAVQKSSEPYRVVAATKEIYDACSKAAPYKIDPIAIKAGTIPKTPEGEDIGEGKGMWHDDFKLPPTFSTWSQVTMLHMYLVFARLRNLDRDAARSWQAQLVDHFFFDAEERMDLGHGISSRGLRNKYLKDLFVQWRGIVAAYDEGVAKNDAVLASAIWRNIFKAREDINIRDLAAIVSWMRLSLKMLDQMPDEALFTRAGTALRWPAKNEFAVVDKPTRVLADQLTPNNSSPVGAASSG
ncbi:ubiquinol-cytochrome C chaperone-domain-containing protein [Xylaria flabelliformis]|nr:ubiquinol-cytochrome C chaperone-domain-containing protein [Xylaria flabelliformis]